MTRIILLDVDGVLVQPDGYRAALRATFNHFIEPHLDLQEETLTNLEKRGITSEWDMLPLLLASYWTDILSRQPMQNLPRMSLPPQLRSTVSAKWTRPPVCLSPNFHWLPANTRRKPHSMQDVLPSFPMDCKKIC